MDKIIIYTDGACRGNPGIGGWGVLLEYKNKKKSLKGVSNYTTNNQMEIIAVIKALENVKNTKINIDLYSDSKYVINGITNWIYNWKKNNWQGSNKKLIKNIKLWQELDILNQKFNINWHWVKGHSNNVGNNTADSLANQAIDELA